MTMQTIHKPHVGRDIWDGEFDTELAESWDLKGVHDWDLGQDIGRLWRTVDGAWVVEDTDGRREIPQLFMRVARDDARQILFEQGLDAEERSVIFDFPRPVPERPMTEVTLCVPVEVLARIAARAGVDNRHLSAEEWIVSELADLLTPRTSARRLSMTEVAAMRRVAPATIRKYRSDGRMPSPDGLGSDGGPRWEAATIRAWMDSLPGQGARTDLAEDDD